MPGLTIISACYKAADRPVVKIGISEYPQEAKQVVTGHKLTSETEIDDQIDDLIRQLESARIDAKKYIKKMNQ
jgi:hypothetical protein